MNASVQQIPSSVTNSSFPAGVLLVAGRIRAKPRKITTQAGPLHLTLVTLPAPDEFTSPSTVEIRSKNALGEQGDAIKLKCRIGGRVRPYDKTDRDTGEVTKAQICNIDLTAIED